MQGNGLFSKANQLRRGSCHRLFHDISEKRQHDPGSVVCFVSWLFWAGLGGLNFTILALIPTPHLKLSSIKPEYYCSRNN